MINDPKRYCFECLSLLPEAGCVCPACGCDNAKASNSLGYLNRTLLKDRYVTGKALGKGGFGITYKGYDVHMERVVAIKEFFPSGEVRRGDRGEVTLIFSEEEYVESFKKGRARALNEARICAQMERLSNVVNVWDTFEANGTVYIVMEYIPGITLSEYIRRKPEKRLRFDEALEMLLPIMKALDVIHKKGVIHRDISPENIMVRNAGRECVLLDFGAAKSMTDTGHSQSVSLLRMGYSPFEQYSSKAMQDGRTDEYALCATLYYALTAQRPMDATQRKSGDEMKWPSELGSDIPRDAEAALKKGMALRMEDRYANMDRLSAALSGRTVRSGIPADPKPGGGIGATRSADESSFSVSEDSAYEAEKKGGNTVLIMLIALVVLAMIGVVIYFGMIPDGKKEPEQPEQGENLSIGVAPSNGGPSISLLTPTPAPRSGSGSGLTLLTPAPAMETPVPAVKEVTGSAQDTASLANVKVGRYVTFGRYPQGGRGEVEPIEWQVMELDERSGEALLISRYGLDTKPYNDSHDKVKWENCSLREWLNGSFLQNAFTASERDRILETEVDNGSAQNYPDYANGGEQTNDKVFLLSVKEFHAYSDIAGAKLAATDYAAYAKEYPAEQEADCYTLDGEPAVWWWLRSPGRSNYLACSVGSVGYVRTCGVYRNEGAIRPVIWVKTV